MKYPAYQINIPSSVRFDRQLSAHAKLLYGEIKALCDKEGYCWASNRYLASLFSVRKKAVSLWIQQLEQQKYIQIEVIKSKGNLRKIYLRDYPLKSNSYPPENGEVLPEKETASAISEDSYPLKKSVESTSLLIDNIIDYNDRLYISNKEQVSSKKRIGIEKKGKGPTDLDNDNCNGGKAPSPRVAPPPLPQKETEKGGATFVKPSVKEVEDHMLGQKEICANAMTARDQALRFFNYYESNGWKVGRNAMQDWQASANNWLLNSQNYTTSKSSSHERLHTTRNKDYSIPL